MPSRREYIAGLGAAGLAATAGCIDGPSADQGTEETYPWPTGGADERNSRAIPGGVAPRANPTVDDEIKFDGLPAGEPIVSENAVLLAIGTDVVAFDRESLEPRWRIDPDNDALRYWGSPTVRDGITYVPEEYSVTARQLNDGEPLWAYEFEYPIVDASPTVVDVGTDASVYVASGEYLVSLDATAGEIRWERRLDGIVRRSVAVAPASVYGIVYVATSGGELYAVDREGRVHWRRTVASGIRTAPVALSSDDRRGGGAVAVGCGDGSIALFDAGGNREWQTSVGVAEGGLCVGHRTLVTCAASTVHALDPDDGSHEWQAEADGSWNTPPILVGDTVYVGGEDLDALDVAGGIGIGSFRVGGTRFERGIEGAIAYVTAADGTLFLAVDRGDDGGSLVALS